MVVEALEDSSFNEKANCLGDMGRLNNPYSAPRYTHKTIEVEQA
jgi:hypothetical protein